MGRLGTLGPRVAAARRRRSTGTLEADLEHCARRGQAASQPQIGREPSRTQPRDRPGFFIPPTPQPSVSAGQRWRTAGGDIPIGAEGGARAFYLVRGIALPGLCHRVSRWVSMSQVRCCRACRETALEGLVASTPNTWYIHSLDYPRWPPTQSQPGYPAPIPSSSTTAPATAPTRSAPLAPPPTRRSAERL